MKLLFDQNLSPRLVSLLNDLFPESTHVSHLRMDKVDDREICRFAATEGYIVITKDADFGDILLFLDTPPKVIWIRRGNCSTEAVEHLMRAHFDDIRKLDTDPEMRILTLY